MDTSEFFESLSYLAAKNLLDARFKVVSPNLQAELPEQSELDIRRSFDNDDHWQKGVGFVGQLPTGEYAAERTELLRKGFSPEPVITQVLDTHVENVLGDEPQIGIEDETKSEAEINDILATVKEWYDLRKNTKVLADALRGVRRDRARVLRAFIPSGNVNGEGRIQAKDLREALSKIWIRSEPIELGGVVVDENTAKELGLFLYQMRFDGRDISLSEYAYLNEQGQTLWGTFSESETGAEDAEPFQLGGHLPIYQLKGQELISSSVCQAQRAINLSGTMLTRNNNLAGSRERLLIGVQPPGTYTTTGTDEDGNEIREFTPTSMATGPGTANFLDAQAIRDSDGNITAYANPNVIFTDPVPIDSFVGTSDHWRKVIYGKAKQLHLLMSDNATASGKSRIEARKEFQSSLQDSKELIDPAGVWMIEVALRIAAEFMQKPGLFENTKAKFESQVAVVELTAEENREIRADYEAGIIDLRTALELRQIKNVDEVMQRIEEARITTKENTNGNQTN